MISIPSKAWKRLAKLGASFNVEPLKIPFPELVLSALVEDAKLTLV